LIPVFIGSEILLFDGHENQKMRSKSSRRRQAAEIAKIAQMGSRFGNVTSPLMTKNVLPPH